MEKQLITLSLASNMFGHIKDDIKKRITNYLDNPTPDNWDDIYCIIINQKDYSTIWQAVLLVDPTFPRSAKYGEDNTTRWERIPTKELLIGAINNVVLKSKLTFN